MGGKGSRIRVLSSSFLYHVSKTILFQFKSEEALSKNFEEKIKLTMWASNEPMTMTWDVSLIVLGGTSVSWNAVLGFQDVTGSLLLAHAHFD
jgi:hypothetical protein